MVGTLIFQIDKLKSDNYLENYVAVKNPNNISGSEA
jgi:hypothetical protein